MFNFNKLVDHIRTILPKHTQRFSRFLDVENFIINTDGTGSAVFLNVPEYLSRGILSFREQRHYYKNEVASFTYLGDVDYIEYRYNTPVVNKLRTLRVTFELEHDFTEGYSSEEPIILSGNTGEYASILNGSHTLVRVIDKYTIDLIEYDKNYSPLPMGSIAASGASTLCFFEILSDTSSGIISVASSSYDSVTQKLTLGLTGFAPLDTQKVIENTKYEIGSDIYLLPTNQEWLNTIITKEFTRPLMFVVPLEAQGVMEKGVAPEMANRAATNTGQYGRYRIKHSFSILVFLPAQDTNFNVQNLHYCYNDMMKALASTLLGYGQETDDYSTIAGVSLSRHDMFGQDAFSYQHEYVFTITTELASNVNISNDITLSYIESGRSLREFSGDLLVDQTEQDLDTFTFKQRLPK